MREKNAKQLAAERAVSYVRNGMTVGLGTGSTTRFAIEKIGEMVRKGLEIIGVPTSLATDELARNLGIKIENEFDRIDITIDGADEVDPEGRLIKGGGGAHTREKIVAAATAKQIIIVDDTKLVEHLGAFPLPVEVLKFGWRRTHAELSRFGCETRLRQKNENVPFITDNGNYVIDCRFGRIQNPDELASKLAAIPGVLEHGLFINLTDLVIIGYEDGRIAEHGIQKRKLS